MKRAPHSIYTCMPLKYSTWIESLTPKMKIWIPKQKNKKKKERERRQIRRAWKETPRRVSLTSGIPLDERYYCDQSTPKGIILPSLAIRIQNKVA